MLSNNQSQNITNVRARGNVQQIIGGVHNHLEPSKPAPINNIPSNPKFVGRAKFLDSLEKKFVAVKKNKEHSVVVMHGLGGIGKTSIAYEYAQKHTNFDVKIRIRAESFDSMKEDYSQIANLLDIEIKEKNFKQIVEYVNQKLNSKYKTGIIIFDNVCSYEKPIPNKVRTLDKGLIEFFPKFYQKPFLILITTKNKENCPQESMIEVPPFEIEDGLALFNSISGLQNNFDTVYPFLYQTLGFHPLAICQAASYIKAKKITFDQYQKKYQETIGKLNDALKKNSLPPELVPDEGTEEKRLAIYTTFDINIEAVKKESRTFLEVLNYAAFMHPEAIATKELYNFCTSKVDRNFDEEEQKEFERVAHERNALVTIAPNTADMAMHRIIQLVLLSRIHSDVNGNATGMNMIAGLFEFFSNMKTNVSHMNFFYILGKILNKALFYKNVDLSDPAILSGFNQAGSQYVEEQEYDRGLELLSYPINNAQDSSLPVYSTIKNNLLSVLRKHFELQKVNRSWLESLFARDKDADFRRKLIDVFLEKYEKMEEDLNYNIRLKFEQVEPLAFAIIETCKELLHKNHKDHEQLAKAYYILGRDSREQAKNSQSRKCTKTACQLYQKTHEYLTFAFSHLQKARLLDNEKAFYILVQIYRFCEEIKELELSAPNQVNNGFEMEKIAEYIVKIYPKLKEPKATSYKADFNRCKSLLPRHTNNSESNQSTRAPLFRVAPIASAVAKSSNNLTISEEHQDKKQKLNPKKI